MAKRIVKNQLPLDYSVHADRMVLALGQVESQQAAEVLFNDLVAGTWLIEPAGEVADVSSAQDIINNIGLKLPYPETVKVAQLHGIGTLFTGFSAVFRQKGWVFVNAQADANERCYHTYLLTVSLGLSRSYPNPVSLAQRAEQLVFETQLPPERGRYLFLRRHHQNTGLSWPPTSPISSRYLSRWYSSGLCNWKSSPTSNTATS